MIGYILINILLQDDCCQITRLSHLLDKKCNGETAPMILIKWASGVLVPQKRIDSQGTEPQFGGNRATQTGNRNQTLQIGQRHVNTVTGDGNVTAQGKFNNENAIKGDENEVTQLGDKNRNTINQSNGVKAVQAGVDNCNIIENSQGVSVKYIGKGYDTSTINGDTTCKQDSKMNQTDVEKWLGKLTAFWGWVRKQGIELDSDRKTQSP
ncbi:hypothetical protein F5Y04DRAFT_19846 [Hypomontagnella monticulosa]|nr:hypothetical protein F5Y04DRAFT_19846 [Hypomontagnella monticulosa]